MKIGRINHQRCDDLVGSTFVWVPATWTDEDFADRVREARALYIADLSLEVTEAPPNDYDPFTPPPFERYPDRLVSAILEEWAEKKKAYEIWRAEKVAASRPFMYYLEKQGMLSLDSFDGVLEHDVYWGHRHGIKINYSLTKAE